MAAKLRRCPQCGEVKLLQWSQITCSMACRKARQEAQSLASAPVGECPGCGETKPLRLRARHVRICSQPCRVRVNASLYRTGTSVPKRPARLRPSQQTCEHCGTAYPPKRYDQRFCSIACNDRWQGRFGKKARTGKAQAAARRKARWQSITQCVLCETPTAALVPLAAFGGRRQNAAALYHRDHILPRTAGGGDEPENLRWLCWFCNLARMDMAAAHDDLIAAAGRAFWEAYRRRA